MAISVSMNQELGGVMCRTPRTLCDTRRTSRFFWTPVFLFAFVVVCYITTISRCDEILVDTDSLTITVGGVAWDFGGNGTLVDAFDNSKGIAEFRIGGDLNLSLGDTLRGVGSRPLSLLVGNDVNIASGATIDFSAINNITGPGGGTAGTGGAGGDGGLGGQTSSGGQGGAGGYGSYGAGPIWVGLAPIVPAEKGETAGIQNSGTAGLAGGVGAAGGSGFGGTLAGAETQATSPTFSNQYSAASLGGQTGAWPPLRSLNPVPFGNLIIEPFESDLPEFLQHDGKDGNDGFNGVDGDSGNHGLLGNSGLNNTSANSFSLTGGAGGSGGSGGAGGQGGQSGAGGAGGGGGQGDWVNQVGLPPPFPYWVAAGGTGGQGGQGGAGGTGGDGGDGGSGGDGGAGGGAFEINALGGIYLNGQAIAKGGDGAAGSNGGFGLSIAKLGSTGENGEAFGTLGFVFSPLIPKKATNLLKETKNGIPLVQPSFGYEGGDGGNGGDGGFGGLGGKGGSGAGGAGGTVKLVGSFVGGTGSVDTSGGMSGDNVEQAGDGRFLLGANNLTPGSSPATAFTGTSIGMQDSNTRIGNRSTTPFVTTTPSVPNLVNLVGGAEAFGYTTLSADTTHVDGLTLLSGTPQNAVAGAIRLDEGPEEFMHDYEGFDMVLVFNALTSELTNVRFGMNIQPLDGNGDPILDPITNSAAPLFADTFLVEGGWENDSRFGGLGDQINGSLEGYEVYATLVPEDTTNQSLNFALIAENAGNTFVTSIYKFTNGQVLYAEFDPDVPVYESTWIGPTGAGGAGTWNTASHWTTVDSDGLPIADVVPNNDTSQAFNVVINSGIAQVEQDTLITIDRLSIGSGDSLSVMDAQRLILERFSVRSASGVIENNGEIFLDANSGTTALRFSGAGIKLTGNGYLYSSDHQDNSISGIRPTDSLIHDSDHSIEMVGHLGENSLAITNKGYIWVPYSSSGNSLIIDPSGSQYDSMVGFVNEGTIEVEGKLILRDGNFQNRPGATITVYGGDIELDYVNLDIQPGSTFEILDGGSLTVNGDFVDEEPMLELSEGSIIQGDTNSTMNFNYGLLRNRGQILNPAGAVIFQEMIVDNTGGVIETNTPASGTNVTGFLELEGGIVRGVLDGENIYLKNVAFEDSSMEQSAIYMGGNGAGFEGNISGKNIDVVVSQDITISGPTVIDAEQIYMDFRDMGDIEAEGGASLHFTNTSPFGNVTIYGDRIIDLKIRNDSQYIEISVGQWDLSNIGNEDALINRGYIDLQGSHLANGTIDNVGGTLVQGSFEGIEIKGGTFNYGATFTECILKNVTLGEGTYEFSGYVEFDSVINEGEVVGEEVYLINSFTNNGGYTSDGNLDVGPGLTIDGGGNLTLRNGVTGEWGAVFTVSGQMVLLANNANVENFGSESLVIINESEIDAESGAQYTASISPYFPDSETVGFINRSTVQNVTLADGLYDNTDGEMINVVLSGAHIRGGQLYSEGPSDVIVDFDSILEDVSIAGTIFNDYELELRGTISVIENQTAEIVAPFGVITIRENAEIHGISVNASSLIGDPEATLTIGPTAELHGELFLGPDSPSVVNEGMLTTDLISGSEIEKVIPAGTMYYESIYVLQTGGDATTVDPESIIPLPEDLMFTSLPVLKNYGVIGDDSLTITIQGVVIENEGDILPDITLVDAAILNLNSGSELYITSMTNGSVIGGDIYSNLEIQVSEYDNLLSDVTTYSSIQIGDGELRLVGTNPEIDSEEPAGQVVIHDTIVIDVGGSLMIEGNVENNSTINVTNYGYIDVNAFLPEDSDPSTFTGFVNEGAIAVLEGDADFSGMTTNNGAMTFTGNDAYISFGEGTFINNGDLVVDTGITLTDADAIFVAGSASTITAPTFEVAGGTLAAESSWIDANLGGEFQFYWSSGGVRLKGFEGHTVGSGSVIDEQLGGAASVINSGYKLTVDETLEIPGGTTLELDGGELCAGMIEITGGSFTFTTGTLQLTGSDLTVGSGGLLGANVALSADKHLVVAQNTIVELDGNLTVSGGSLTTGTLDNSSGGAFHLSSGELAVGALSIDSASGSTFSFSSGNIELTDPNAGITVDAGSISSTINGVGGITKVGAGTLSLLGGGNGSQYTGPTNILAGKLCVASGGRLSNLSNFTVAAGAVLEIDVVADAINGLFGEGEVSLLNNSALVIGNVPGSNSEGIGTFDGQITGQGSLFKRGPGTFTMTGANTYDGVTQVEEGILLVENSTGSATGAGNVIVQSGATLGGSGFIGGQVTVEIGGTLGPGASFGLLTVDSLVLEAESSFAIEIGGTVQGAEYDALNVTGLASLGGALEVALIDLAGEFAITPGSSFEILSATGGLDGEFEDENLPTEYAWNLDYGITIPNTVTLELLALIGDMNGDNLLNEDDINPFVLSLTNRTAHELAYPTVIADAAGDVNGDGSFNLGDVAAFKALFIAPTPPPATAEAVPEPSGLLLLIGAVASLLGCHRKNTYGS